MSTGVMVALYAIGAAGWAGLGFYLLWRLAHGI